MIEVVAALIWDNDKFLICQRPAGKNLPLLWEFAGGKVEKNESKEDALIRECLEELNIKIKVDSIFHEVTHNYDDFSIHLTLFNAHIISGTPEIIEHNDIKWVTIHEVNKYEFCPADKDIIEKIINSKK